MKIKLFLTALFIGILASSQEFTLLANVNRHTYNIRTLEITASNITVILDENGDVAGFYDTLLEGSIDYNDVQDTEVVNAGKIKSINDMNVFYWETKDRNDERFGKIKSIGSLNIDYWDSKSGKERFGKVKSIGNIVIDYEQKKGFDVTLHGKYNQVGNVDIVYYNDSYEKSTYGQLKKIGDVEFTYWDEYSSSDAKSGRLRTVSGNSELLLVKVY